MCVCIGVLLEKSQREFGCLPCTAPSSVVVEAAIQKWWGLSVKHFGGVSLCCACSDVPNDKTYVCFVFAVA